MNKEHRYHLQLAWTGNLGKGTQSYRTYSRNHEYIVDGKPVIPGSSEPSFRGDPTRYNPEELFVSSLSSCHMLWYLHLATTANIIVTAYTDKPVGTMIEEPAGNGWFSKVVLHPTVTVQGEAPEEVLRELHHKAHDMCFIANSVKCAVTCEPVFVYT